MSESSLSSATPSHANLERALCNAVQQAFQNGNLDELTIRRVRAAAEKDLDLEDGFYKNDPTWKEESKRIIQCEVEAHNDTNSIGQPSNSKASAKPKGLSTTNGPKETNASNTDVKRHSTGVSGSKKRKKLDSGEESPDAESTKAKIKRSAANGKKNQAKPVMQPLDEDNDIIAEPESDLENNKGNEPAVPESESEMSVVIDEMPKRKSKGRGTGSGKSLTKKAPKAKASKLSTEKPVDADADEIKRLQGWLVKCGIRKMWFKELAPYETPKLKIQHLKEMLSDAGMTGRYSNERATQIRNERELKADLEAVQEGEKQWGKSESEDSGPAKPRRRLARGLRELDMFLNGSDGEETD